MSAQKDYESADFTRCVLGLKLAKLLAHRFSLYSRTYSIKHFEHAHCKVSKYEMKANVIFSMDLKRARIYSVTGCRRKLFLSSFGYW